MILIFFSFVCRCSPCWVSAEFFTLYFRVKNIYKLATQFMRLSRLRFCVSSLAFMLISFLVSFGVFLNVLVIFSFRGLLSTWRFNLYMFRILCITAFFLIFHILFIFYWNYFKLLWNFVCMIMLASSFTLCYSCHFCFFGI